MNGTVDSAPAASQNGRMRRGRAGRWGRRGALALLVGVAGCAPAPAATAAGPFPPYPDFGRLQSASGLEQAARGLSERLRAYVERWMAGRAPAALPNDLVPDATQAGINGFRLLRPDQVDPKQQWGSEPRARSTRSRAPVCSPTRTRPTW